MIEIKDEILAGVPKYRITDNNGNIIADNVTIEMITQMIQAGTPMNKELFERFENDYTNHINRKIELSDIYNTLTLTTENKTITDTFRAGDMQEESTTRISSARTGFIILASAVDSDHPLKNFSDGNDSSYAVYRSAYITFQRNNSWKLKQIRAKIRGESSKAVRISLDNGFKTSGNYISYDSTVQESGVYDFTIEANQQSYFMRSITGSSSVTNYDINAYELYAITYETLCNVLNYTYNYEIADGTVIKFKTPSTLDETIPTVLKIGNTEINLSLRKANTNYEIIWNDESSINASLPISIKTGTVSDGGTIPRTEGFLNYVYFVSPNSAGADSAESNSYEADGNGWSITCSVSQSSRVVTSKAVSKTRRDTSNEYTGITTKSATANYIEIAWN